jgi:hypothetical protein
MSDEIPVGDTTYVSSRRASELSGYAQDYIGQLARSGQINAKRVGGLWYVHMDSLESYRSQPQNSRPIANSEERLPQDKDPDVFVSFDGRDYISASRASKITGYNQDYIGQLARGGKILARQVGARWYVDREGILAHKTEKDALLASVQAAAVGIQNTTTPKSNQEDKTATKSAEAPLLRYIPDDGDLVPVMDKVEQKSASTEEIHEDIVHPRFAFDIKKREYGIPIAVRRDSNTSDSRFAPIDLRYAKSAHLGKKSALPGLKHGIAAAALAIIIAPVGLLAYDAYINGGLQTSGSISMLGSAVVGEGAHTLLAIADSIEQLISPDIIYERGR